MARPLSEEKRSAILAAAAELVAASGTGAPTAGIAKAAGVAEGTLFTYFATKDELLNQLFLELEAELAATTLDSFPMSGRPRDRSRHLWDRLVDWSAANPVKRKAIRQLKESDRLTEESRRRGVELFREITTRLEQDLSDHVPKGHCAAYIGAILDTLVETTLDFMARDPARRAHYKQAGFDIFWKGIGR